MPLRDLRGDPQALRLRRTTQTEAMSADVDPCPYCDTTSGVARLPGKVAAWSCADCGTNWAVTVINPRPYLDRLAAAVELAEVLALADSAPGLTDAQLREALSGLASRLAGRIRSDDQSAENPVINPASGTE